MWEPYRQSTLFKLRLYNIHHIFLSLQAFVNTTTVASPSRQNLNLGQSCKQFLIEQSNLKHYRLPESLCDLTDLNTEKHDIRMTFPSTLFSQLLSSQ